MDPPRHRTMCNQPHTACQAAELRVRTWSACPAIGRARTPDRPVRRSVGARATFRSPGVLRDIRCDPADQTWHHARHSRREPGAWRTVRPLDRVQDETAGNAPKTLSEPQGFGETESMGAVPSRSGRTQNVGRGITPAVRPTRPPRRGEAGIDDDRESGVLPQRDQPARFAVGLCEDGVRGEWPPRGLFPHPAARQQPTPPRRRGGTRCRSR